MTDKQIVVDGVDVSKCKHVYARTSLFKGKNLVECTAFFLENEDSNCNCSDNPNCYYKQLKRKEQECEMLKKEIINRNEKIEELRFSVSDLTNRLCDLNAEKSFRIVDLEQTLIEIKEVLQFYNNITIGEYKGNGVFEFKVCNENVGKLIYCYDTNPAKQALQKIDEAINE